MLNPGSCTASEHLWLPILGGVVCAAQALTSWPHKVCAWPHGPRLEVWHSCRVRRRCKRMRVALAMFMCMLMVLLLAARRRRYLNDSMGGVAAKSSGALHF